MVLLLSTAGTPALATAGPSPSQAASPGSPPNETDHGLDKETFHTLWSGDRDAFVPPNETAGSRSALAALANGTDVAFDRPPAAVAQWNRGDHAEYPNTSDRQATHPSHATLEQERFIKDAAATVFAVQPSTRARLTRGSHPLYVASNGSFLGTVDYRVALPSTDGEPGDRTLWRLVSHRINETRLLVDGRVERIGAGEHTPTFDYRNLKTGPTADRTLTLAAEIEVSVERTTETCAVWDNDTCRDVRRTTTLVNESVTVTDSIDVVVYDLSIAGYRAQYPDGDLGLVVYKNQPWLGHSLPEGTVRGVWRFYTARDTRWDSLVVHTADEERSRRSPSQPLQTHAYPFEPGPTLSQRRTIDFLATYGTQTEPPSLPGNIHLDVLETPYTASYGIATRTETSNHNLSAVVAEGLVRGVRAQATPAAFDDVAINRSNLTLEVVDRAGETVTVEAQLVDRQTGAPIETGDRDGFLLLGGERVNTSTDGTVRRTASATADAVSARYVPGDWWMNDPGYTADSDVVAIDQPGLAWIDVLYRVTVWVGLFLLAVALIDRITGWRLWPPWRGL